MTDEQQAINRRVNPHVPSHAWQSTVALVVAHGQSVRLLGTGVLFQVAECPFVVTAGHVIRAAHKHRKTIGLGDTGQANLVPFVVGEWQCSTPKEDDHDQYDVAIYRLGPDMIEKLAAKRFLRIADVSFGDPGPRAVFTVFGYPGLWSEPSGADSDQVISRPLEFTTYAFDGPTGSLINYQPRLHLLLAASPEYVTWFDGSPAEFRDRRGQSALFPRGLKGISGASIWHVGDLGVPIERWSDRPARVVGVNTGIYQPSGVITATRWAVVTTIIHGSFPDLRRSIELWNP